MTKLTYDEIGISRRRYQRKERICKAEGCKTILNSYNPKPYCIAHQAKRLLSKIERREQKFLAAKHRRWFQLSKWQEYSYRLDTIGTNFAHRKIKSKRHKNAIVYAVWVKD